MTIGERIRKVREEARLSQVELADYIKVSKQTLYKYETGIITNIPSDKIEEIAKATGVSPAYIMGWEQPQNEEIEDIRYAAYQELEGQPEEVIEDVLNFIKFRKSQEKKDWCWLELNEIYNECERCNVDVYYYPFNHTKAISLPDGTIAIDVDKVENSIEEKEIVAHELGHINTGSFYNVYTPLDIIGQHERRAEKRAIKKLVPENELNEAIQNGIVEPWELAEYFDVSEMFIKKAI